MTPTSTGTAAMSPLESEISITPKSTPVRLSESDDMSITSLSGWCCCQLYNLRERMEGLA